jgi:hypothetical protein
MNHKWLWCTIATFVFVLFWSLGGVVPGIHANQRQEITRLAEGMPEPASSLGSRIRLECPPSERQTQELSPSYRTMPISLAASSQTQIGSSPFSGPTGGDSVTERNHFTQRNFRTS